MSGAPAKPGLEDLQQGVLDLALAVPNVTAEICDATAHTRIGWLRSVYNIFQAFSIGSFVDELADASKADPREMSAFDAVDRVSQLWSAQQRRSSE